MCAPVSESTQQQDGCQWAAHLAGAAHVRARGAGQRRSLLIGAPDAGELNLVAMRLRDLQGPALELGPGPAVRATVPMTSRRLLPPCAFR